MEEVNHLKRIWHFEHFVVEFVVVAAFVIVVEFVASRVAPSFSRWPSSRRRPKPPSSHQCLDHPSGPSSTIKENKKKRKPYRCCCNCY